MRCPGRTVGWKPRLRCRRGGCLPAKVEAEPVTCLDQTAFVGLQSITVATRGRMVGRLSRVRMQIAK